MPISLDSSLDPVKCRSSAIGSNSEAKNLPRIGRQLPGPAPSTRELRNGGDPAMGTIPAFASATQALDMVRAGLRFLASADATQLTAAERAACLRGLEHADSVATAARTS